MDKPSPFKTLSTRTVYKNPWITVREDAIVRPDGSDGIYSVVEIKDSVIVIAVDKDGRICLVKIFRYPVQKWCYELPMGGMDADDILDAARRELKEETGLTARKLEVIGKYRMHPGQLTEYQNVVLATGLRGGKATDEAEGISEHEFVTLEELDRLIESGGMDDAASLAALSCYGFWLDRQAL